MQVKVHYDPTTKYVHSFVYDLNSASPIGTLNYVICEEELLVDVYNTITGIDLDGVETTQQFKSGKAFPMSDIVALKKIAAQTIDYWRQKKQSEGYTHTSGITYGSNERMRALCIGKIQEMQIVNSTSGIFPDINGVPVTHTISEMEAVGTGMAAKIEADYIQAVGLVSGLQNPGITTLADIELYLQPVLTSL